MLDWIVPTTTECFRKEAVFYFFRETALPDLARIKAERGEPRTIRVLSAGCSDGREPYGLAMMAEEARRKLGCEVEIVGIDINKKMLGRARIGEYEASQWEKLPRPIGDRYLRKLTLDRVSVSPEIRNMGS